MKKPTTKRIGLGLLQHLLAAGIMLIIAVIVFNSYVAVKSMNGTKTYMVNFFGQEKIFEDSKLFHDIFETAVSDITRLVVIKGQLESDGMFDPAKRIDITEYASRKGNGNGCPVTAVYELDDLIKWGKYGIEYTNRTMSMSDFVNYFGPVDNAENFALDEYGQLYFHGFSKKGEQEEKELSGNRMETVTLEAKMTDEDKKQAVIVEELEKYTTEQVEDMAFSYIIKQIPQGVSMSREDDGTLTVNFNVLNCRYETVDGERQLLTYADNWVDYMKLQSNLTDAITNLAANYQQYQNCNGLYQENRSNLKYAVRMMTEEGIRTYTNVSELESAGEEEITEYFGEYRRYFIYYPDSLEFFGNTSLTEDDIYGYMREYDYAYPETTHIWIGVDTSYSVRGDAFYNAYGVFQKIVPNMAIILTTLAILLAVWLSIGIYLTFTAGIFYNEEGKREFRLSYTDHIWTELIILLGVAFSYLAYLGFGMLSNIAEQIYLEPSDMQMTFTMTNFYRYGMFFLYGMLVSLFFGFIWYGLARRLRGRCLWKNSLIYRVLRRIQRSIRFMVSHGSTAVSVLIPYNFFLMINLAGIFSIYLFRDRKATVLILLAVLVLFDGVVGVLMFRNNAERLDIVEGIKRIRDGEVDYKLDAETLHGTNREMADAVNNIGEGIRKAVRTSMKDEQMKTDLITNVSHDLKTPLTSIISYVDLLKRQKIQDEPVKSYIQILDNKSQRLKQLTDDLVEASKISSGNIVLQKEQLNLTELLNQTIGEFSEKLEERQLQAVFEGSNITAHIFADSRRMWRIAENLFNNICKYALEGTRVYIDLAVEDGEVRLSVKNISERQMNLRGDDLTERFIRGDASRTTEGSGLGLSIAKSLTEVQDGTFSIHLDGDLFKVIITFPEYIEEPVVEEEISAGENNEDEGESRMPESEGKTI